jgi:hypothetical protein
MSATLINQDSGDTEYYTDPRIIEAARNVLGVINVDPASSELANKTVQAEVFYDKQNDGLKRAWYGTVWMNHPFSRVGNPLWINHLLSQYAEGNVDAFLCITFASTSEKWFQPLLPFLQCFLSPRTNYYLPDGTIKKGVTKGSVVTYGGPHLEKFIFNFSKFGYIK